MTAVAEMETEREPGVDPDDGVDVSLIRWFLSLTPSQRLDYLQNHNDAILAIRARNAGN